MVSNNKYSMSFTTGGLFYNESVKTAQLFTELGEWSEVRECILQSNLYQARTVTTLKKIYGEVCSRLKLLTNDQLQLLNDGTFQEQNHMLWISVCKRYLFIHDFAVEVIREKYLRMDYLLLDQDFNIFFDKKAEWHEELDRLKDSTRKKVKQVLYKMLREARITLNESIVPAILSKRTAHALLNDSTRIYSVLPVSERDIKEWAT